MSEYVVHPQGDLLIINRPPAVPFAAWDQPEDLRNVADTGRSSDRWDRAEPDMSIPEAFDADRLSALGKFTEVSYSYELFISLNRNQRACDRRKFQHRTRAWSVAQSVFVTFDPGFRPRKEDAYGPLERSKCRLPR
jgi:hypothetical protein